MAATAEELRLAEPDGAAEATVEAWYMDDSAEDQRAEHRLSPNEPADLDTLQGLGVLAWHIDSEKYESDPRLLALRKVRGYTYQDVIDISPATLPGYDEKIKSFFKEHLHADEEIRCVLRGSGYFDVRDHSDRWIRIHCPAGAVIVLPAGIYHRFTLDANDYIRALRLFQGDPVWTPLNRPHDDHAARLAYLSELSRHDRSLVEELRSAPASLLA